MTTSKTRARQQAEWLQQEQRKRRLMLGLWIVAGLAFVGMLVYLVWQETQPVELPGVAIPIQGQAHIQPGQPHEPYNSDPPTSGPHFDTPAQAGFYHEAPLDEQLVHNLEHGHVIIWYNCSDLTESECDTLKDQIESTMGSAGLSSITGTLKLVAVPRPTMDTTLALTSWGRLDKFDEFDRDRVLAFIRAFRDRAPENNAP